MTDLLETPAGILSDDDAAWMQRNLATAPPEKMAWVQAKLNEYHALRTQHPKPPTAEEISTRLRQEDAVRGLYESPDKADFGPLMAGLPGPERAKQQARVSNEYFLAHETGTPREELLDSTRYASLRGQVAGKLFGGRGADDDAAFAAEAGKVLGTRRDFRYLLNGKPGDDEESKAIYQRSLDRWATRAAFASQPVTEAYSAWVQQAKKSAEWKSAGKGDFWPMFSARYSEIAEKVAPHKGALVSAFARLREGMGVSDKGIDEAGLTGAVINAASPLMGMSEQDFRRVGVPALRAMAELAAGDDKGKFQQVMEAFRRPLDNAAGASFDVLDFFGSGLAVATGGLTNEGAAQADKMRTFRTILRSVADDSIDPIRTLSGSPKLEQLMYDVSGSFGYMAAAAVPAVGVFASAAGYQDQNKAALLLAHPEMEAGYASVIAAAAAPVQTALDRLSLKLVAGKLPVLSGLLNRMAAPGGSAAVRMALYGAGAVTTEYTAEKLQDAAPLAMQDLHAALRSDIPNADWSDFQWMDERTFWAVLPLALLGAGVNVHADQRAALKLTDDSRALSNFGLSDEAISRIQGQTTGKGKLAALQAEWANRKVPPPDVATQRWQDYSAANAVEAETLMTAAEDAGVSFSRMVTPDGPRWQVRRGDAVTDHADAGSAMSAVLAHMDTADQERNQGLLEMADALDSRPLSPTPASELTIAPSESTVTDYQAARAAVMQDSSLPEADRARAERESAAMTNRMAVYEAANPDTPVNWSKVYVGGQSELSATKEGLAQAVLKVTNGASPYTVLEERTEADAAAFVASGKTTWDDLHRMIREVEAATGDTYVNGYTGGTDASRDVTAVKEAYSELAQVYATGKSRAGKAASSDVTHVARVDRMRARQNLRMAVNSGRVDSGIVARLKAYAEWLKTVVGKAIRLNRARREGGAGFEIDAFLNQSLGIEPEAQHAAGAVAEAERIFGPDPSGAAAEPPAFSLREKIDAPVFEAPDKAPPLTELTDIPLPDGSPVEVAEAGRKWLRENKERLIAEIPAPFVLASRGVGKMMQVKLDAGEDARAHFQAVASLPQLLGDSVPVARTPDREGAANVAFYERRYAWADFPDGRRNVLLTVRYLTETAEPPRMYSVEALEVRRAAPGHVVDPGGKGSVTPDGALAPTVAEFLAGVKPEHKSAAAGPSFRLMPTATLDKLSADLARRSRDPEARRRIFDQMQNALSTLRRNWTQTRSVWNGETRPKVEKRTAKELNKEQAVREAIRRDELEDAAYERHADTLNAADLASVWSGPVMQSLAVPGSRLNGRLMSPGVAARGGHYNPDEHGDYDGIDGVPRIVFGGTMMPDEIAEELHDAGLLREPTADALWSAIKSEVATAERMKAAMAAAQADLKRARETAHEEAAEWRREQDEMQAADWNGRAVMLRHLRTLDALLSALPAEVRAKVGGWTAVASLRTQEAMQKELEHRLAVADKHLEASLKKTAMEDIRAVIEKAKPKREAGKKPRGKLGADAHRFIDEVEAVADMTEAEVDARRVALDDALNREGVTVEESADIFERQQILDTFGAMGKPPGHTAAHLTRALDQLETVYATGKNRWRMLEESRLADIAAKKDSILDAFGKIRNNDVLRSKDKAFTAFGMLKNGTLSLKSFAEIMDTLLGEGHPLAKLWARAAREGMWQRTDEVMATHRDWARAIERATGKRGRAAQVQVWDMSHKRTLAVNVQPVSDTTLDVPIEMLADVDALKSLGLTSAEIARLDADSEALPADSRKEYLPVRRIEKGESETVNYTEAEGIYLSMLWAQEQYRDALRRHGFGEEAQAEIEEGLSDSAKLLRGWLHEQYADGYAPLARQFRNMFGVDLPQIDNYAPGKFYNTGSRDTDLDVMGMGHVEGGFRDGFLGDRKTHTAKPRAENAFQVFFAHNNQTAHWKALAPLTRELRGVFSDPRIKEAIDAKFGQDMNQVVQKWIAAIEGNGLKQSHSRFMQAVMTAQAYKALAWKLGTLMKQSTALLGAAYRMPPGAYIRGLGMLFSRKGMLDYRRMWGENVIQRRLSGGWTPEVRAVMAQAFGGKPTRRAGFLQKGMEIIGFVDALFTTGSAVIAYDYHKKLALAGGMGPEEAHAAAMVEVEHIISRTAQPTEVTDRSLMEMELGSLGKTLFMFSSEARQKSSLWLHAWGNVIKGKPTANDVRALVISHLVVGPMIQAIGSAWRDLRNDDDDTLFDSENWNPMDFLRAMTIGPLQGVPLLGELLSLATGGYTGDGLFAPYAAGLHDLVKLAKGPQDGERERAEWYERRILSIANALPFAFPSTVANISDQAFRLADNAFDTTEEADNRKLDRQAKADKEARAAAEEARRAAMTPEQRDAEDAQKAAAKAEKRRRDLERANN